jgi:hypothetical protein
MTLSLHSLQRWVLEAQREKNWQTASKQCKQKTPYCQVCKAKTNLEAHDVKPYHLIKPEIRAKMTVAQWLKNMRTLNHDCHMGLGHCEDPECMLYNPHIDAIIQDVNMHANACTWKASSSSKE